MPPYSVDTPSPAMSVLKAYLQYFDYTVDVIYWNLLLYELENEFLWNKKKVKSGDPDTTLLYAAYMAAKNKDGEMLCEVKSRLQAIAPIMLNDGDYYDKHIIKYVDKLDKKINEILGSIEFDDILYFGFSMKLDQWTLAAIIADRIKSQNPKKIIVIGGINTPEVAKSFLQNFSCFDIATYGEGEIPLKLISDYINSLNNDVLAKIPRTFFKEGTSISQSMGNNVPKSYSDLSDKKFCPIYDDYFKTLQLTKIERHITIIVEGSRGCHWNRCHFCYLNKGYLYRKKDIDTIIFEIRNSIQKYGIYRFEFADNDTIGNDLSHFHKLLDQLIAIKCEYPEFAIIAFEIITKQVDKHTIEKMRKAGVTGIQIGYESASDTLLKKIEKKNSFASNLNVIKHCLNNRIIVNGVNVIRNLLEESSTDIFNSIENLRFYRFMLDNKNKFIHIPNTLQINSSSRYFIKIDAVTKLQYRHQVRFFQYSFEKYMDEDSKWHFFESNKMEISYLWEIFNEVQFHFLENEYSYSIQKENNQVNYIEFYNGNKLESFLLNDIQIFICNNCYDVPISIDQVINLATKSKKKFSKKMLSANIDFLYKKGLVYRSSDYKEITSLIEI